MRRIAVAGDGTGRRGPVSEVPCVGCDGTVGIVRAGPVEGHEVSDERCGRRRREGSDRRKGGIVEAEDGVRAGKPNRPVEPLFQTDDAAILTRKSTRLNSSHVEISYAVF